MRCKKFDGRAMSTLPINLRKKAVTVAILMVGATLAGPFGTYEDLTIFERLVYWGTAILGCGLIMEVLLIVALTYPILDLPAWVRFGAAVFLGSFPATVVVLALEYFMRGYSPGPMFALRVWLLVGGVAVLVSFVEYRKALRSVAVGAEPPTPVRAWNEDGSRASGQLPPSASFLRSIDPALRHGLVSLSKQGHYLEVVTRRGAALILKRMSDAVAELDGYRGMQIHRSHWVALDAVREVVRDDSRVAVRLDDGRLLPVSRPNLARLRSELSARDRMP
ncbi:LytTR family transcriptional regulator [Roseibacterium sp. SDUM158016]|nr:LytTR family transcriptional regulator [Roseibacterium sp. SDUM158016]